jgi:hypothetical protein
MDWSPTTHAELGPRAKGLAALHAKLATHQVKTGGSG